MWHRVSRALLASLLLGAGWPVTRAGHHPETGHVRVPDKLMVALVEDPASNRLLLGIAPGLLHRTLQQRCPHSAVHCPTGELVVPDDAGSLTPAELQLLLHQLGNPRRATAFHRHARELKAP